MRSVCPTRLRRGKKKNPCHYRREISSEIFICRGKGLLFGCGLIFFCGGGLIFFRKQSEWCRRNESGGLGEKGVTIFSPGVLGFPQQAAHWRGPVCIAC